MWRTISHYTFFYFDLPQVGYKLGFEWKIAPALILLLALEIGFNGWSESTLGLLFRPRKTDWWDIFSFFALIFNVRRVFANLLVFGLVAYLLSIQEHYALSLLHNWPVVFSIPLALFVQDFLLYWSHRWKHTNRMLWWVHEFHHSATRVTVATSYRIHPLDFIVSLIIVYFPMDVLFGWGLVNHLAFLLVPAFSGKFNHSRLDTDLGWFGKWLLVSPRYHHYHHSNDERILNKNFGETLRIWDKLFGTDFGNCATIKDLTPGMPENPYEDRDVVYPLVHATWEFYAVPSRALKRLLWKGGPTRQEL